MKSPRSTVDLRQVNSQTILRHLFLNGPMTRLELCGLTGLSPSTITNVTSEMFQSELLIERGMVESYGGRPRTILDINPHYGYLIGTDLGETHVQMELFDLSRHKIGAIQELLHADEDPLQQYIRIITNCCMKLITDSGVPINKILGLGLGVPGIVGHNKRVTVAAPMWGWKPIGLLDMIENQIQLPVYIDNGAKAMALAEAWFGTGRGVQDMVVLLIGRGIGAGIITRGTLYRGATNSAGEWGHTKLALTGRPCRCGGYGCLEAYVGAPGIIKTLYEATHQSQPMQEEDQYLILTELISAYKRKDKIATKVLQDTAQYLGLGIANLVNLFNPELIVIGGWPGVALGEVILDDLNRIVKENAISLSTDKLRIGLSHFGEDAICLGAACLVLEEFLSANIKFSPRQIDPQLLNLSTISSSS